MLDVCSDDEPPLLLAQYLSWFSSSVSQITLHTLYDSHDLVATVERWLKAGIPTQSLRLPSPPVDNSAGGSMIHPEGLTTLLPYLDSLHLVKDTLPRRSAVAPGLKNISLSGSCGLEDVLPFLMAPRLGNIRLETTLISIEKHLAKATSTDLFLRYPRLRFLTLSINVQHNDTIDSLEFTPILASYAATRALWTGRGGSISIVVCRLTISQLVGLLAIDGESTLLQDVFALYVRLQPSALSQASLDSAISGPGEDSVRNLRHLHSLCFTSDDSLDAASFQTFVRWLCLLFKRHQMSNLYTLTVDSIVGR